MNQPLALNNQGSEPIQQRYFDRLMTYLSADQDFAWAAELIRANGTGGAIEITLDSKGKIKSVQPRLRRLKGQRE